MPRKNILVVVGTRPNFIKVTQFKKAAANYPELELKIVHTGQHFDEKMADVFFKQFSLNPDYFLDLPQGLSPNSQVAQIMMGLEKLISDTFKPHWLICVGDVNSTLAAALTANKLGIALAHLESGLRSFDNTMPEEHNRIIADKLSQAFFVTEPSGLENLKNENVPESQIHFVGNTMIDTLVAFSSPIDKQNILQELALKPGEFVLTTIHRPATVDSEEGLNNLLRLLQWLSEKYTVVFPIHPRTLQNISSFGLKQAFNEIKNMVFTGPQDYFAFQKLVKECKFVLTDSGGIQEETTYLQIPCLTLRPNTERPVTCTEGTNTLIPFSMPEIKNLVQQIENGSYKKGKIPEGWDGKASERIMRILANFE